METNIENKKLKITTKKSDCYTEGKPQMSLLVAAFYSDSQQQLLHHSIENVLNYKSQGI